MRKSKRLLIKARFYYDILGYRLLFYLALNIIVTLLDGIGLAMFIPLFTTLSNNTPSSNSSIQSITHIIKLIAREPTTLTYLIFIIIIFLVKGIFKGAQVRYLARLRYLTITNLRINLLKKYTQLSYLGYLNINEGKIYNTITNEVGKIFNNLTNFLTAIQNIIIVLTYIFLITSINPKFFIVVVILLFLISISLKKLNYKTSSTSEEITDESNKLFNLIYQINLNFKYLKSTNKLSLFINKTVHKIKYIEKLNFKMGKELSVIEGIREPIAIFSISFIIYIQINISNAPLDTIIISLMLLYRAIIYFNLLKSGWQAFDQTSGSISAVQNLTRQLDNEKDSHYSTRQISVIDNIKLTNLSFNYKYKCVLKNINLIIESNTTVAITGDSGSGKTTLLNIMLGLLLPSSGDLAINDIPISEIEINSYRNKIGYIPQEPVIFNDSIYNNVTLFSEKNEENIQQFWNVIKTTSLIEFTNKQVDKEDTVLLNNGANISGGQKQRIAIARELFKKVNLLIMDEATSNLNFELENSIQENINKLKGRITIIIVAHRITTIKTADKIYLINNNTIECEGSFNQLYLNSSKFKSMVSAQIK